MVILFACVWDNTHYKPKQQKIVLLQATCVSQLEWCTALEWSITGQRETALANQHLQVTYIELAHHYHWQDCKVSLQVIILRLPMRKTDSAKLFSIYAHSNLMAKYVPPIRMAYLWLLRWMMMMMTGKRPKGRSCTGCWSLWSGPDYRTGTCPGAPNRLEEICFKTAQWPLSLMAKCEE